MQRLTIEHTLWDIRDLNFDFLKYLGPEILKSVLRMEFI